MRDRPGVSNNTALVALWVLGRLDLLHHLYGEVLIPEAVHSEFLATEHEVRAAILASSRWIKRVVLANPQRARVYVGLDGAKRRYWHWPRSVMPGWSS